MANNQLSEKLDLVTEADLKVDFDDLAVWSRLEERLDGRKRVAYWWAVAACVLVLTLFLPISILEDTGSQSLTLAETIDSGIVQKSAIVQEEIKEIPKREKFDLPFTPVEKKGLEGLKLAQISPVTLILQPIEASEKIRKRVAFAAEDISIIQASLERPKIGKGRTMTIRAQWPKSPTKSNVEHQALKIKLYEKQE